jgi:RNA polymerase sigma-70 factor (ECF subfamily)
VAALLAGDEATYLALVKRHHRAMIHVARLHLGRQALAEEVAQDAWLAVLRQLHQWSGRGSLRGWIYGIVANQARSRAARESRTVPLPEMDLPDVESGSGAVATDCSSWCSWSSSASDPWSGESLERREVLEAIRVAIERLPPRQRAVMTLRDVAGCDGAETCAALRLSEGNQRVLLHRARTKVRRVVEDYLRS